MGMRRIAPLLLAVAAGLNGCGEERRPAEKTPADASAKFAIGVSGKTLRVRVAVTELEQAAGLMHTTSLPADEGMLFAYRGADRRAFWMMNVPYDIDAGHFTADGRLDEVVRLRANDATPVDSASPAIRYVLEAPAGWFAANGLGKGAALDMNAAAAAIRARGFAAEDFVSPARP